jgi:hypothetical protein
MYLNNHYCSYDVVGSLDWVCHPNGNRIDYDYNAPDQRFTPIMVTGGLIAENGRR